MQPAGNLGKLERRRLFAPALLEDGLLPSEVARRVGVDRRSVRRGKPAGLDGSYGPSVPPVDSVAPKRDAVSADAEG